MSVRGLLLVTLLVMAATASAAWLGSGIAEQPAQVRGVPGTQHSNHLRQGRSVFRTHRLDCRRAGCLVESARSEGRKASREARDGGEAAGESAGQSA